MICDYYIHKTALSSSYEKMEIFATNIETSFTFRIRVIQLEHTKFPVFSLCFGKISKFPVFSLTGNIFCHFPCFPCACGNREVYVLQYVDTIVTATCVFILYIILDKIFSNDFPMTIS